MSDLLYNPAYWRARADEARAIADQMQEAEAKRMMLEVAETYDKLGADAERRLKQRKK
jgi:hypothetical protein